MPLPFRAAVKTAREVFLHISFYPTYQTAARNRSFMPERSKGLRFRSGYKSGYDRRKKTLKPCGFQGFYGCGEDLNPDLRVMSPTSYRTALSRDILARLSLVIIATRQVLSRVFQKYFSVGSGSIQAQQHQRRGGKQHPVPDRFLSGHERIERAASPRSEYGNQPRRLQPPGCEAVAADVQIQLDAAMAANTRLWHSSTAHRSRSVFSCRTGLTHARVTSPQKSAKLTAITRHSERKSLPCVLRNRVSIRYYFHERAEQIPACKLKNARYSAANTPSAAVQTATGTFRRNPAPRSPARLLRARLRFSRARFPRSAQTGTRRPEGSKHVP